MKKLITILLLIFFSAGNFSFAEENFPFVVQVTTDNLNIRAGYNINFEVIAKLKNEDKITVLEKKFNWYKVELPADANSFISVKYVNIINDNEATVVSDRVNVRARPDLKSTILCQLGKNDLVNIVEKSNQDWYRIKAPANCYGWVNDKYVKYYSSLEEHDKEKEQELARLEAEASKNINKGELLGSEPKFEFENTGTIKKVRSLFKEAGSYKLVQNGKLFSYLKSDKVELDSFTGLSVKVSGNLDKDSQGKYPVVIVEKISIIE